MCINRMVDQDVDLVFAEVRADSWRAHVPAPTHYVPAFIFYLQHLFAICSVYFIICYRICQHLLTTCQHYFLFARI